MTQSKAQRANAKAKREAKEEALAQEALVQEALLADAACKRKGHPQRTTRSCRFCNAAQA